MSKQIENNQEALVLQEALKDNESLVMFMEKTKQVVDSFVEKITGRKDFSIRLEVRGSKGRMLHCKLDISETSVPKVAGKNTK